VLVILLPRHGTLTRPLRTARAPARELPQAPNTGTGSSSGSWRLASYLVSVGWQRGTAGPEPGNLTCPTNTTCYGLLTTSQAQLPLGRQYHGGVTFLSTTDAGRHFGTSAFPAGQSMQALSCPAAAYCVTIGASSADLGSNSIAYGGFVLSTGTGAGPENGLRRRRRVRRRRADLGEAAAAR
jgi:hypothetical protein